MALRAGRVGDAGGERKKRLLNELRAIDYGGKGPGELGYLAEMNWLHEHGVISGFGEYLELPINVYEDALVMMEWDIERKAKEANAPKGRR